MKYKINPGRFQTVIIHVRDAIYELKIITCSPPYPDIEIYHLESKLKSILKDLERIQTQEAEDFE